MAVEEAVLNLNEDFSKAKIGCLAQLPTINYYSKNESYLCLCADRNKAKDVNFSLGSWGLGLGPPQYSLYPP